MSYLLDANVFIEAAKAHYGFDIVPAFWDWLESAHADGTIYTVEAVVQEIVPMGDQLSGWMKNMPKSFKLSPTGADGQSLQDVATWASGQNFTQAAVAEFLSNADYFLVAQAHSLAYKVVTQELPDPASKKRVKIPDACNAFGVLWMSPFKMLSTEGVQFSLA